MTHEFANPNAAPEDYVAAYTAGLAFHGIDVANLVPSERRSTWGQPGDTVGADIEKAIMGGFSGMGGLSLGDLLGGVASDVLAGFQRRLPGMPTRPSLPGGPTLPGIPPTLRGPSTAGRIGRGVGTVLAGKEIYDIFGNLVGGGGRRYRRMNVLNPRALRRSMRRVQGFAKFAKKTISFTKRVKMKKRRR